MANPIQEQHFENAEPVGSVDQRLEAALADANLPTLLLTLAHLTGDDAWLAGPYAVRRGRPLDDNDSAGLELEVAARLRKEASGVLARYRNEDAQAAPLSEERLAHLLSLALGEEVGVEYGPLLAEELGTRTRDVEIPHVPAGFHVLVIGAGVSGICAAIKLEQAGVPYTILEKDPDVGGAWLENIYPGCGVDTPSHLYSFSFDPNTRWTRYFAKRDELHGYLQRMATEHDLLPHIRFGTEVLGARYDEDTAQWHVSVRRSDGADEELVTPVLVSAVGMVNRPSIPPIPGLETFRGPTMHTAAWHPDVDLKGKRVAVIGTGASAMQLVPSIVDEAERVLVFQRSKQWALPHPNYGRSVTENVRYLMDNVPFYAGWYRMRALWNFSDRLHASLQIDRDWPHMERSINHANDRHREFLTKYIIKELGDRTDLIDACVPDYPPYSKRALLDNGWFRTMTRDDVDLVTEAVGEIREAGVVTTSGQEYPVDVVLFATGFKILQFLWPMEIIGAGGAVLRDVWGPDDARAYLGITVPRFPNLFVLNGPNTNAGHGGSAIIAAEFQVRYLMQAVALLVTGEADALEVRQEVFDQYQVELDAALGASIWAHHGTTTYHRNAAGRVVVSSPWKYLDYWQRTLRLDPDEYHQYHAQASRTSA